MAERAKHAFGALENIDAALSAGKIDAYDILFVQDADGKPYVGWIDKNGQKVICDDSAEFAELEAEIANKASVEELAEVDAKLATKANAEDVDAKISEVAEGAVATAKSYTDGKIEAAMNEHMTKKYEIASTPIGTLVNYGEKEIRVMCPVNTEWTKQNVGSAGNANMYYMSFKAYAPEEAVSFKEGDRGVIVDEMFDFNGDFSGVDEYGRKYSICWLALASYDAASDTWTYFGKNSSATECSSVLLSPSWFLRNAS